MRKLICNAPWGKAKPSNFARVVTRLAGTLAVMFAAALPAVAETYTWNGGSSGSISTAANWSPAPGGAFTASDELVIGSTARITVDSATTVSKITVTTARNVSFLPSGGGALTVTRIANTSTGVTQFFCPVQFTGTYYVEQTGAVRFPGGATATYPDAALRTSSSSDIARTLDGIFTFTADWNVPNIGDGSHPWIIAPGSEVRGRVFTGSENGTSRILYLPKDAYACFTTVAIGNNCGEIGIDGFLEATTEITVGSKGGSATLGSGGKTGTVKAPCIRKVGGYYFNCNTPNIYVGAGGIGADHKDYTFRFTGDATITATANFDFLGVYNSGNPSDWCFNLNDKTVTLNIPEGLTATLGVTVTGSGVIRKAGKGTLVMTNTDKNGQSGYVKNYTGGTVIEEGTVRLAVANQIGTGPVTIREGGRLEVASGIAFSNVVTGDGTLYLENGTSLAISSARPCLMGEVALASGANVTVTATDTPTAPAVLLSGVSAADYSRFTLPSGFSFSGGAAVMTAAAAATDYVWAGANGDDWATPANWLVNGATPASAPGSGDTIRFENTTAVTVGGTGTLTVTKIVTTSGAAVTFSCPVQFAGTYIVENAATAPVFAGGATATYPDALLTNMNIPSHILPDGLTLTQDWTIPLQPENNPFVVPAGTHVTGRALSAETYSAGRPDLRVDKGGVATFNSIAVARRFVFWLNGGRLVATGDVTLGSESGGGGDFGYYAQINDGVVEANGVYKSASGGGAITCYVTNFVVGAGGFGMLYHDYNWNLQRSATITAKSDTTIHQPIGKSNEGDWGLQLDNNSIFTVDTDEHRVVFDSLTRNTGGRLVKVGTGELVMQSRAKLHTGGTDVKAGKMTVNMSNGTGRGLTTVESGATISFTANAPAHAYPITIKSGATLEWAASVNMTAALVIESGVTLKPAHNACFDVAGGSLVLPGSGTVTIDMSGFTFTDGVPIPILGGVSPGEENLFTLILPQDVAGTLTVSSSGILSFTSGSATDLYWDASAGVSVWSTSTVAWTNATGTAMAFTPYANATIADAATISIPSDVEANDVTVSADGDVTLAGAGGIAGTGTFTKSGTGTLTFNAEGGLDAQPVIVSNGVFRLGDDLSTRALGGTSDSTPLVIAAGATLDVNYSSSDASNPNYDPVRSSLTHDKLIKIAGDGVDGKGAIVSTNQPCYIAFSDVELTDDATIGGTVRSDFRHSTSYGHVRGTTRNTLTGPGKCLTVKNSAMLALVGTTVNLGSILVPAGGELRIEQGSTWNVPGGIRMAGGKLSFYGSDANPGTVPMVAESGSSVITGSGNTWRGPVTVAPGATLTHESGTINYEGAINGKLDFTGGTMNLINSAPTSGWTLNGSQTSGIVHLRQSGTFTGADVSAYALGVADVANTTVDVTFNDSTLDIVNLYLGWGGGNGALAPSGHMSIGPGTTLTAGKICVGDDGTSTSNNIQSVISVDGGTVNVTNVDFFIAYNGPHSDFIINSGVANIDKATIKLRANNQALGGYNTARFIQNGGTFTYGGPGFTARFEDNTDEGQIIFKGGEMNATANWSIPHFISTCFKDGDANGWTLNQTDGTTATWNTALTGDGDVSLNGAATLVGNKEVQGVVGGKWTIGDGFTAGLEGAASLLGGLDIGEGASVSVNIATDRSAVFTARDFGDRDLSNENSIVGRFNKKPGGTTRGTITHDETLLFTNYAQAARPFGDMNYSETYAVGHFYVEESKTGTWSFEGKCDDRVALWIDGEQVMISAGDCATVTGTKEITTAGWHTFRHVISDNTGGFGADNGNAYQTIGYKDPTMSAYARFNVKNLKMRPAADMGDPNNATTVRWRHYKGSSSDVTANTFMRDDFAWDFCCITNTLDMIQWKGNSSTYMNGYTVNRYDGWFYVTPADADKEWTFRSQYDDRCALWIDGVDSGLRGDSGNTQTYSVTLSRGWHKFRIQTADFTGGAGPWDTGKLALSYQVVGDAEKQFTDANLAFSLCPDGYIQGDVTLASNATLSNTATENAAVIYGNVIATGTGATMDGAFKFDGGALAFTNVVANANDLTTMLAFTNPAVDYLADVGAITVDFTAKPTRNKMKVGPAGGLTAAAATQKVRVTVDGEPLPRFQCLVENGDLKLRFAAGTYIIVR